MSDFAEEYRSKLTTPAGFVRSVSPGSLIQLGVWYGQPYGVMKALDEHWNPTAPLSVMSVHTTAPWRFLQFPGVRVITAFHGPVERAAQKSADNVFYIPAQFADIQGMVRSWHPFDYFIHRVALMDEDGFFNFSLTASWEYRAIEWIRKNRPETKIVFEVNPKLPRVFGIEELGGNRLPISHADIIVEDDTDLMQFPRTEPTETEARIARNVARLIPDRATIQLGFGSIPMAIGHLLGKRHELGIHTEMFCEAHIGMIEAGAVTNAHKGVYDGKSVCTFALGPASLHEWCRENPEFVMAPVEVVNDVRVLGRIQNLTSINGAINIDLAGQVCAHCIGPRSYSGFGGAFEFAYGAQLSPGGRAVTCMPSTSTLADGSVVSNIIVRHPAGTRVTLTEQITDWVATEHGAVRIKFLNLDERAAALISIAHPMMREGLERDAMAAGLRLPRLGELRPPPASFFSRGE